jgi:aminopeptidase-like protein
MNAKLDSGAWLYDLASDLFPICRSITGEGFRQSLDMLGAQLPGLKTHGVPSGSEAFDWTVPPEWWIKEAYIETPTGERICRLSDNNLHVVGYSEPVSAAIDLEDLQSHLYSLPDQPDAIPYVTSYYERRWGFCLTHQQRESLVPGKYRVFIDSGFRHDGELNYGEFLLPGEHSDEVLISTYLCHPSMANNELSGPVVSVGLVRYLASLPRRRYSYRLVVVPETIGSLVYLSRNLDLLQDRVRAGFVVSCVGDERCYSYLPSRAGDTLADRALRHVLGHHAPGHLTYSFLDRGSDERQYCSPGVDLPVASFHRSKYGAYPEYHTSLDDLDFITPDGLHQSLVVMARVMDAIESNNRYQTTVLGEPQLGKRGLYPTLGTKSPDVAVRRMMNLLAYADGQHDLIALADRIGEAVWDLDPIARQLQEHGLLKTIEEPSGRS